MQNKVGGKIGDAVLENAKKSTEGLSSFIGQLEQMYLVQYLVLVRHSIQFCLPNAVMEKRRLAKEDALT